MAKAKKNEMVIKEEKVVTPKVDLTEIKNELTNYVNEEIKKGFNEEVKRINNKLVREKNKKIVFRNIIILILLVIIGFLVYLLNSVDYFDKFFVNDSNKTVEKEDISKQSEIIPEENEEGPSLDELKNEFSYLLGNIKIDETSIYISDYYNGKLTDELKNYLTLNMLEFNNLVIEDDCNIIEKDLFKEAYAKLFDGELNGIGFDYNGNKVRFLSKLDSFVSSTVLQKIDTNIKREIIDIKIVDEIITITTVEGVINNDRLYNILTKEEVKKYKKDSIINYQDNLNTVIYTFKNNLLENISK